RELNDEDKEIIEAVGDKKCILILNKIDLESKIDENMLKNFENIIRISAKDEIGLDDLKESIKQLFFSGKIDAESLIISNSRHKQALFRALENAENALSRVRMNEYLDLISIFVTSSLRALNEITGDELEEDLVNKIFGDFCVGK
ncbi:MAG: tRNA uridine-5-carboxymethylaminomethyl(34) synthesis GTPase MnmE, partial [Clostridium sp.]|nr:tRNA uridine-5-carboxymethylaminomethyl(34) synthesis GTPase MnmE [Clostridium sp.]